ncbi:MAG: hypothetical protein K2X47_02670 [Bdellovibrionales bacterium]|nr:hypothetical protein [Bdellovibrionales bacterium]
MRHVVIALFSFVLLSATFEVCADEGAPKTVQRSLVSLDYNSWFQELLIKSSSRSYETQGLLYGLGINYHYSVYYSKMGWGLEGGYIQGFGVAGKSSSTTDYYANRVPLQIFRLGGRIFSRLNSKFDLGATVSYMFGAQVWPYDKGFGVETKIGQAISLLVDSHWMITDKWELIQGVGTYSGSRSIAWRLGACYLF